MTRQKEIRNAIDTIFPIPHPENGRKYEQALMATGFEAGVKWADKNPKSPWISIDDDLPYNHEELLINKGVTKKVFVLKFGGLIMANRKVIKSTKVDYEEDYSYLDEDEYMSLGEIEDMMW